jgi:hypothetical protein
MLNTRVTSLVNHRGAGPHQLRSRSGSKNPGPFVLTLGAVNPERGSMAKKKGTKAKKGGGAKNGTRITVVEPRAVGNHRGRKKGKKNPAVFGHTKPAEIAGMVVAVLGGVTVVKLIPPMFPVAWTQTNASRFAVTFGVAILTGIGAHALLPAPYRDAAILGALAQTGSVGLNVALPSVSAKVNLGRIPAGRRGVGDFVPGGFPEPHNPIARRLRAAGASGSAGFPTPANVNLGVYKKAY